MKLYIVFQLSSRVQKFLPQYKAYLKMLAPYQTCNRLIVFHLFFRQHMALINYNVISFRPNNIAVANPPGPAPIIAFRFFVIMLPPNYP